MVDERKYEDQVLSHKMVNYANAALQGIYAYNNVLMQLQSENYNEENVKDVKSALAKVKEFINKIWDGQVIFEESKGREQGEEAEEIRSLLKLLIPNFQNVIALAVNILRDKNYYNEKEKVYFLLSLSARECYAKDAYINGMIDFARIFNKNKTLDVWHALLEDLKETKDVLAGYVKIFQQEMPKEPNVYSLLAFNNRMLPNIFASQLHDLYQLLSFGFGEFNFAAAKFDANEARLWERENITAQEAGYWRAYGIAPNAVEECKKNGFTDPVAACSWLSAGFNIQEARDWVNVGLDPLTAFPWFVAKYTPEEAVKFINDGQLVPNPSKIKRDF